MIKLALVHDRLAVFRGGERVFQSICELYPDADAYALLADAETIGPDGLPMLARLTGTSFLRAVPRRGHVYRQLFPLYPLAARSLPLGRYDVVISSSSAFAHWVQPRDQALHLCYLYTPLRQAWSEEKTTALSLPAPVRPLYGAMAAAFRRLDRAIATRVTAFATTSAFLRTRIQNFYGRSAEVIPPGINLDRFVIEPERGDYFLVVSALVPYKRVDLAIEACTRLKLPLKIVGTGPEMPRLRATAGAGVEFVGAISDEEVVRLYSKCRALIFPAIDDFGITCVEAQASGRPVIAAAGGGAQDIVIADKTGTFFTPQTADGLCEALSRFSTMSFDSSAIRRNSERFAVGRFKTIFGGFVAREIESWSQRQPRGGEPHFR